MNASTNYSHQSAQIRRGSLPSSSLSAQSMCTLRGTSDFSLSSRCQRNLNARVALLFCVYHGRGWTRDQGTMFTGWWRFTCSREIQTREMGMLQTEASKHNYLHYKLVICR